MRTLLTIILLFLLVVPTAAAKKMLWTDEHLKEVNLEYRNPLIRDMKILLKGRGYKPGDINGEDNEEFRNAIKEFEKASGREETGEPTFDTYQRLLAAEGINDLKIHDFTTKDGCNVSFRYSVESEVLVIKEKCTSESGLSPVEDDGEVAVPGMSIDYIPTPFGQ